MPSHLFDLSLFYDLVDYIISVSLLHDLLDHFYMQYRFNLKFFGQFMIKCENSSEIVLGAFQSFICYIMKTWERLPWRPRKLMILLGNLSKYFQMGYSFFMARTTLKILQQINS